MVKISQLEMIIQEVRKADCADGESFRFNYKFKIISLFSLILFSLILFSSTINISGECRNR